MRRLPVCFVLAPLVLGACDNGTLTVSVADAPIDQATSLVIKFSGVDVVKEDGTEHSFTLDPPKSVDFLSTANVVDLLTDETLPAGDYKSITLHVSAGTEGTDSKITIIRTASDSGPHPLTLNDSDSGGLTKSKAFRIERRQNTALIADFDLRKSVLAPDTGSTAYRLVPSMRLVLNDDVGSVIGTVSSTFLQNAGCASTTATVAVYLYAHSKASLSPDDVGGAGTEPDATAIVRQSKYSIPVLDPDTYTAVVTCDAADDDPQNDDAVTFLDSQDQMLEFTVTAGETATENFQ